MSTHTGPGGGYDTYLRLLSRHLGKHIPGHPSMLVVNQPGGGGLTALNYAGKVAPQDGTWLALVSQGLLVHEATGRPGLQVSLGKFSWIGNLTQSNNVTVTWYTSKGQDHRGCEEDAGDDGVDRRRFDLDADS